MKTCAFLFLWGVACASGVIYKPHISLVMKNTTSRWRAQAKLAGPNICAKETIWDTNALTYDVAWTGGSLCVRTHVQLDCCEGWLRVPGEAGCTQATPLLSVTTAAERKNAGWFLRMISTSGFSSYWDHERNGLTIFAPMDSALSTLGGHSRQLLEHGTAASSRLIDAPALLLSHVIRGHHQVKNLKNDQILTPLGGNSHLRANVYPNGLTTINCVPIVARDIVTKGPLLHVVSALLPQNHLLSLTDLVLREHQTRYFASYLAQSRMDTLLRSSGPFTLLLPTDAAFEALGHHYTQAFRYDEDGLKALVGNHILDGVQCSAMLHAANLRTKQMEGLKTQCKQSEIYIKDALIVGKDRMASNGVAHLIDRVLLPRRAQLLLTLLRTLGLTIFADLVERGGLTSTFVAPDAVTVFAPSNQALQDYRHLNPTDARGFILNHMASGKILTTSLRNYQEVPSKGTRSPFFIQFLRDKTLVDAATVLTPDEEGLNGIIHVIEKPLTAPSSKTILQWLRDEGHYSHFMYSLRVLNPELYNSLETAGKSEKFTVFAVSDSYVTSRYQLYYGSKVLGNHVLNEILVSEQVPQNGRLVVTTTNNDQLLLVRRGNNFFAGSALIVTRDIFCSNGVIHLATTDECPQCGTSPHDVPLFFSCPQCPTTLKPQDLWDRPIQAAEHLQLETNPE